ncbi:MAG: hypothetical protein F7C35_06095 [Desulfurococcales archaeon]|nr:hypothetical protein [Desulfurococcales archaeon]
MSGEEVVRVLRSIAEAGGRKGFEVEVDEGSKRVVVRSKECPISVLVAPSNSGFKVELRVEEGLRDCIEDLLEEDVDPRNELENIVEELISIVDLAAKKLAGIGIEVERSTREAVLDVYDTLESFLEEEE